MLAYRYSKIFCHFARTSIYSLVHTPQNYNRNFTHFWINSFMSLCVPLFYYNTLTMQKNKKIIIQKRTFYTQLYKHERIKIQIESILNIGQYILLSSCDGSLFFLVMRVFFQIPCFSSSFKLSYYGKFQFFTFKNEQLHETWTYFKMAIILIVDCQWWERMHISIQLFFRCLCIFSAFF